MFRIVLMADHTIGYDIVKFMLEEQARGKCEIVKVYTNSNPRAWWPDIWGLKEKYTFDLCNYDTDQQVVTEIKKMSVDFIFLCSWKHFMSDEFLNLTKTTFNLHYSLLPRHRGTYPVAWAISAGDKVTGVTIHKVDSKVDSGETYAQRSVIIESWDTCASLLKKMDQIALDLFSDFWNNRMRKITINERFEASYHSTKNFVVSNELDLKKVDSVENVINLLRSKTFEPYQSNLYYIDPSTKKKVFLSIQLTPEHGD